LNNAPSPETLENRITLSTAAPIDTVVQKDILDAVDSLQDHSADLLKRLVRHRSILGNEQPCIEEMASMYEALGLAPHFIPIEEEKLTDHPGFSPPMMSYAGRTNVAAVHRPRNVTGRSLLLQGHLDVVHEGAADLWASPPYDPAIRDGRLYGRGSGDMKAGHAAILTAVAALRRAGMQPAAELQLAAVIEEECTGNGALATMLALPKPEGCIIPEPGPGWDALWVSEVGVVWAWVTVTGRPVHVRQMQRGINAIDAAYVVVEHFRRYEARMNEKGMIHPAFAGEAHPVNVNFGTIEGGEWNSSVPTRAKIGLRVGVMLGRSCRQVQQDIREVVASAGADPRLTGITLDLVFRGFTADACLMPPEQPIARLVQEVHLSLNDEPVRPYCALALTDARFYALYSDTQVTCYGPDGDGAHGIDESVSLASLHRVTRTLALAIANWCGLEPIAKPHR
jgi:acetylornithine deacetylase